MEEKKNAAVRTTQPQALTRPVVDWSQQALAKPPPSPATLRALFDSDAMKKRLLEVVPKHVTPERLLKVALASILKTPKLMLCSQQSLIQSIVQLGEIGLEPGGGLGLAYLVPYKTKQGGWMAQAIIGYRGYIHLARRSGEMGPIRARVVHEKDQVKIKFGLVEELEHIPSEDPNPGKPRLVYCIADFKDGGHHMEVMTWAEVMKIKARSKAQGPDSPWATDEEEMAKKTCVRRSQKYWPLATEEMSRANEIDDEAYVEGQVTGRAPSGHLQPVSRPVMDAGAIAELPAMASDDTGDGDIVDHDPVTGEVRDADAGSQADAEAQASAQAAGQDVDGVEDAEPTEPVDNFLWRVGRAKADALPALVKEAAGMAKDHPRRSEAGAAISARRKELGL